VIGKTLRFITSSAITAGSAPVTAPNLLDLLCVATGTSAAYRLAAAVRVNSLEMWSPMASDLVPVTCSVEWSANTSTFGGPSMTTSDTSMGSSRCAHVRAKPPASSLAAMWQGPSATQVLFNLICPANTVLDIHLAVVLRANETSAVAVAGTVSGATVGVLYCRTLYNGSGIGNFAPVGWQSI